MAFFYPSLNCYFLYFVKTLKGLCFMIVRFLTTKVAKKTYFCFVKKYFFFRKKVFTFG